MKATRKVEFSAEEVKTIDNFFDLLIELGQETPHIRTIDLFGYLIEKWAYQKTSTGDTTLYLDRLDEYVENEKNPF